jgi:predicted nucleotidyltransferase
MTRDEAILRLKRHEDEFKRLGVEHLYLFGSTARDEAREDSDVDLFFDHPLGSLGLFELMDVKEAAASEELTTLQVGVMKYQGWRRAAKLSAGRLGGAAF